MKFLAFFVVLISCAVSAERTCPRCTWSNCEYPGSPAGASGNSEKFSCTVKMLAVVCQRFCRLCSLVAFLWEIFWIKFFVASVFLKTPPPSPQGTFPQALLKEKSQYPFFNLVSMELSSSYFFETCSWGAADRAPGVSPMLSKGSTTELDLSQLDPPGLTSALKCFGEMYSKVSCDCSPILNGV